MGCLACPFLSILDRRARNSGVTHHGLHGLWFCHIRSLKLLNKKKWDTLQSRFVNLGSTSTQLRGYTPWTPWFTIMTLSKAGVAKQSKGTPCTSRFVNLDSTTKLSPKLKTINPRLQNYITVRAGAYKVKERDVPRASRFVNIDSAKMTLHMSPTRTTVSNSAAWEAQRHRAEKWDGQIPPRSKPYAKSNPMPGKSPSLIWARPFGTQTVPNGNLAPIEVLGGGNHHATTMEVKVRNTWIVWLSSKGYKTGKKILFGTIALNLSECTRK